MTPTTRLSLALLGAGVLAGTLADRTVAVPPLVLGGYRVVAADFHTHSSTWSDGTLTPWGLAFEARRQGLEAIAITGHNEVLDAKAGRWISSQLGGPTILVGQEILAPGHHVIAVGLTHRVDSRLSVAEQIDEVHRQGGVAIAAHPFVDFSAGFDDNAVRRLDGAEICHPGIFGKNSHRQEELERFAARGSLAAIGSSDFHGLGRMGVCRTYVFARDDSAAAIVDALRAHRTVVYGLYGKAYGDPTLVALANTVPRLREIATTDPPAGWLDWISRVCGAVGLLGIALARRR